MKTKIINIKDDKAVSSAVAVLKKVGLIIYPTETSYGIGADATNVKALRKIIKVKTRKSGKFIPIIISDSKMAEKYIVLNKDIRKLMRKFMPGPLTLVAKKKNMEAKKLLGGFRIPANKFALKLARCFGKPITATSANISGSEGIYKIKDVVKIFKGRVDLIIDSGNLPIRKPSTVFDVSDRKILRRGNISKREILKSID